MHFPISTYCILMFSTFLIIICYFIRAFLQAENSRSGGWGVKVLAAFGGCKDSTVQLVFFIIAVLKSCTFSFTVTSLFPCWFLVLRAVRGDSDVALWSDCTRCSYAPKGCWRIRSTFLSLRQVNEKCVSWGFLDFFHQKNPTEHTCDKGC